MVPSKIFNSSWILWYRTTRKKHSTSRNIPLWFQKINLRQTNAHLHHYDTDLHKNFSFLSNRPKNNSFKLKLSKKSAQTTLTMGDLVPKITFKDAELQVEKKSSTVFSSTSGVGTKKSNCKFRIMKTAQKQTEEDDNSAETGEVEPLKASSTPAPDPLRTIDVTTQPSQASDVPPVDVPVLPPSSEPSIVPSSEPIVKSVGPTVPKQDKPINKETDEGLHEAEISGHPTESASIETIPEPKQTPAPITMAPQVGLRQRAVSSAGIHGLGRIQLSVKYGPKNNLVIVIHKVESIPLNNE
ncbi:unnamed protein product, partial [Meganyctiphanes norvegica]